ncbi:MAG: TetR/AcrR family transcriptional regulator [Treponema sp.]|jgi:AcrR family transcriptional regulator|nr:TetR/AcrR family transcriptional regulator [Treponema sp.]
MKKTDIRVRFTQKVLQDSLIELMKEKSVLNITIREICERGGVSRSTFYTYYNDQYELLRQIEEETYTEIDKIIQPYISVVRKSNGRETTALIHDILQSIAENGNSIQVLLSENGDSGFQKRFFSHGIEAIRRFTEFAGTKPEDKKAVKYGFVFVMGGMLMLVQEWLKNGMDTPVPELAKMIARLTRGTQG